MLSGYSAHFQTWKVWLCSIKKSNKIGKNNNNKEGCCSLLVMMFGVLFSESSVHFQIWKVWLCYMKNRNKVREILYKRIGMVVDDVKGC